MSGLGFVHGGLILVHGFVRACGRLSIIGLSLVHEWPGFRPWVAWVSSMSGLGFVHEAPNLRFRR